MAWHEWPDSRTVHTCGQNLSVSVKSSRIRPPGRLLMSDVLELADRFFAAIEAGDIAAVRELYAPDAEIWHNTDGLVQTPDDNARTLTWITANLGGLSYTNIKRSAT